jgi:hypothetical protein
MATQWLSIYQDVCNVLLESIVLQSGMLTDAQFYALASETLLDFLSKTGLAKKLFNIPIHFAISTYTYSDQCSEIVAANASETYIEQTSGFYLDNQDPLWQTVTGNVHSWREDELVPKTLQVKAIPNVEGYQVSTTAGQGGYGVLSSTSSPNDFDVVASYLGAGYGTQADASLGDVYVETTNPGYGVRSNIVPSTGNLSLIGTALPANITNIGPSTYVELVPDSFVQYIKYGILARIWSQDGEFKDSQRSAYAQARYAEGISILSAWETNIYQEA